MIKPFVKHNNVAGLTDLELWVLRCVCNGISNKEMAESRDVSRRTVEIQRASAYKKIGVSCATDALLWAIANRVIKAPDLVRIDKKKVN